VLQLVPHVFLCRSLRHHQKYADGKMAYCYVLTVSIVCTDKQDMLSVKFHLNEFCKIFVAEKFGFALLFTFYCGIVDSQCPIEMCVCYSV